VADNAKHFPGFHGQAGGVQGRHFPAFHLVGFLYLVKFNHRPVISGSAWAWFGMKGAIINQSTGKPESALPLTDANHCMTTPC
jgi:hypothetical protein